MYLRSRTRMRKDKDMTEQETIEETVEDKDAEVAQPSEQEAEKHAEEEAQPKVFPLNYVQRLCQVAADARVKAKRTDALAECLHTALVSATGRLADPSGLPFDDGHLEDADALTAALDVLLKAKPHLASRCPRGDVGQGQSGGSGTFDLAGMLRQRAG